MMQLRLFAVLSCLAVALATPVTKQAKCGYESCHKTDPDMLNVHIVPHTHDDVGWLKTVDQYYYGSRNNIQLAGVQYILDSVIKELWEDADRRFIYVETAFFWKWWVQQTEKMQNKVRTLVSEGRLQFVGGAWSMNDEADTHYQSTIDQFTFGLKKLQDTFGDCATPRVGWQIDPFGHSREFASLLAAMGYDGLFLGRIDYQDKSQRLAAKNMEMIWRGDDDLGNSSDIFTGVLFNTYSPPAGFCFDILCGDDPIVTDISSPLYNVDRRISEFLSSVESQQKNYITNNVIITMGGDFNYQDAVTWFSNMDKLIKYTNLKAAKQNLGVKLLYSTPDCYLKAVRESNPVLNTKYDDFFPYASDPHAYWTGYFTSRPTIKYFEREGNRFLQMAKQLQVLAALEEHNNFMLDELKSAMGIMQHHDAVTGTEKQHVTYDYERILDQAIEDSLYIPRQAFTKTMQNNATEPLSLSFDRCRLNISECMASEESDAFVVTVYNPLAWKLPATPIKIPVYEATYKVFAPNGDEIDIQLLPIPEQLNQVPTRTSKATHELVFIAKNVKPLGYKNFYVKKASSRTKRHKDDKEDNIRLENKVIKPCYKYNVDKNEDKNTDMEMSIAEFIEELEDLEHVKRNMNMEDGSRAASGDDAKNNGLDWSNDEWRMLSDEPLIVELVPEDTLLVNPNFKVRINNTTGEMVEVNYNDGTNQPLDLKFFYYEGFVGNNDVYSNRSSGAYIFRPIDQTPVEVIKNTTGTVVTGKVLHQVHYTYNEFISAAIRVYNDENLNYIELDWLVGPIPINDNIGKEIVVKYSTDFNNNGTFYTDSNGRQVLKRQLNKRPEYNVSLSEPVSGNYYPIVNKIYIEDKDDDSKRFAIITDRAEGGSSLQNGAIELMLHRRLLHDDAFGVGEALNETVDNKGLMVRGSHRIVFQNNLDEKISVLEKHLEPLVFVSPTKMDVTEFHTLNNCHGWVKNSLPHGVHLLTVEPWGDKKLLLRLENYLEKKDGNSDVIVNLNNVFDSITLQSLKETKLAANQPVSKEMWKWRTYDEQIVNDDDDDSSNNTNAFSVTLKAREIRTFIVDYKVNDALK